MVIVYNKLLQPSVCFQNAYTAMCCQEKNCPPENFYPRIKIFSDCVKFFCSTLKIFVRLARPCLTAFSLVFSVLLATCKCFSYCFSYCMLYNLFHHSYTSPRIISDSFLVTTVLGCCRVTAATEQPDYHALA